jgi:hypothetical protein
MTGSRELRNGKARCRAGAGPRPGVSCCSCGRYDAGRTAQAVRRRSRRRVSVDGVAPVARPNCRNERDHCAHLGRGYPFPDVQNRPGRIHDGRNRARPAPRAGRAPSGSRRAAPVPGSGPPPARPAGPERSESWSAHDDAERNPGAAARDGARRGRFAGRHGARCGGFAGRHSAGCGGFARHVGRALRGRGAVSGAAGPRRVLRLAGRGRADRRGFAGALTVPTWW